MGSCIPIETSLSDARGPTLRTPRLVLRRWRAEDLAPFAELNADPDVLAHMQKTMSREESDELLAPHRGESSTTAVSVCGPWRRRTTRRSLALLACTECRLTLPSRLRSKSDGA